MDSIKQAICDWLGLERHQKYITVEFAQPRLLNIPKDGFLIVSIPADLNDLDLAHIRKEAKDFFEGYKVAVVRKDELGFYTVVGDPYHTPDHTMEGQNK